MLKYVLHIKDGDLLKQDYVVSMISPYVDMSKKPRLIEPPQAAVSYTHLTLPTTPYV